MVISALLYIHSFNLKIGNMKKGEKKGWEERSFSQESKEEVGSAEARMNNRTKNDRKRGKESLGGKLGKKAMNFNWRELHSELISQAC